MFSIGFANYYASHSLKHVIEAKILYCHLVRIFHEVYEGYTNALKIENLPIYSNLYKSNALKISYS